MAVKKRFFFAAIFFKMYKSLEIRTIDTSIDVTTHFIHQ